MQPIPISVFEERLPEQIALLRQWVEQESPTTDKNAVDAMGSMLTEQMRSLGATVQRHPQTTVGDHLSGQWGSGGGGILLLAHMDTVHPLGALQDMPWREEGGKFFGPGVLDMKSGILIALSAIQILRERQLMPSARITLVVTSDEETGSETSRSLIERTARDHDLVFVLEPSLPDGSIKTWRKGVGMFELEVIGRAAHAGVDPASGINAIVEMAMQVPEILALQDLDAGTTLNVGVIQGGTRSNVVPDRCKARVDVRVMHAEETERIERALQSLTPKLEGAKICVAGNFERPPMPRTEQRAADFERAKRIAELLGIQLTESGTGGGSDANFVAPFEISVLDGLGAVGDGAHSNREYIQKASLAPRTALLAALLTHWHQIDQATVQDH